MIYNDGGGTYNFEIYVPGVIMHDSSVQCFFFNRFFFPHVTKATQESN